MTRPFAPSDNGKRFIALANGATGVLEFPLEDPGTAKPGEGILWYGAPRGGALWDYVAPADVRPVDL